MFSLILVLNYFCFRIILNLSFWKGVSCILISFSFLLSKLFLFFFTSIRLTLALTFLTSLLFEILFRFLITHPSL